jgi:hypothetical protein
MLACADCDAVHDVNLAPDTGTCVVCGGPLVEDKRERAEVGAGAYRAGLKEVAERTNELLAGVGAQAHVEVVPLKPEGSN